MAVDMFLKLDGIKGESHDSKHKDDIDVLAWHWGATQTGSGHGGGGSGTGKVSVQDLSFTHYVDRSSPTLFLKCCTGEHIKTGELVVRKAGKDPLEYMVLKLNDVIISSVSHGGSHGEDRVSENVSINFAKVEVIYTEQKEDGSAGPKTEGKYNIKESKTF